jgi:hypothetical protein
MISPDRVQRNVNASFVVTIAHHSEKKFTLHIHAGDSCFLCCMSNMSSDSTHGRRTKYFQEHKIAIRGLCPYFRQYSTFLSWYFHIFIVLFYLKNETAARVFHNLTCVLVMVNYVNSNCFQYKCKLSGFRMISM